MHPSVRLSTSLYCRFLKVLTGFGSWLGETHLSFILIFSQYITRIGPFILITNAMVAFLLNVAAVFLVGVGSGLVLTLAGVFKVNAPPLTGL
jgi:hypothetical protein